MFFLRPKLSSLANGVRPLRRKIEIEILFRRAD
jgi:hypothetical protein